MSTARAYAVAATLPSGDVLVAGGQNDNGSLSSAELYGQSTRTWRPAASMSVARANFTATVLNDGNVLVAGGASGVALAEVYHPATNSWSPAGDMSSGRNEQVAVKLLDGRVLVAGGADGGIYLASADVYDPASNSWSSAGAMSIPRTSAAAVRLNDGRVLVTGGHNSAGGTATAEIYDPATNDWSPAPSMSSVRFAHVAVPLSSGDFVLVAGGSNGVSALASAEIYSVAGNSWSPAASMSTERSGAMAAPFPSFGGDVVVLGGTDTMATSLSSAEVFSFATNTWSSAGDMTSARDHAAVASNFGTALVAGGSDTGTLLDTTEIGGSTGPAISASAPGTAAVGDTFDVTFSTSGVAPNAYSGYGVEFAYNSLLVSISGVVDRSVSSGLFGRVMCGASILMTNLGGALTPPIEAALYGCESSSHPTLTTKSGALMVAHVHVHGEGQLDFHLLTPFTYTDGPRTQINAFTCGGSVCGSLTGAPAADVVVDTNDSDFDGYSDLHEQALGTDPGTYCPIMRADVNLDGTVNVLDLSAAAGAFLQAVPPAPARLDQGPSPFDRAINILDLSKMAQVLLEPVSTCP